jgi:hypothetical protein
VLRKRLFLLVPLLALFAFVEPTEDRAEAATWTCAGGTHIRQGADIDRIINNDPSGTATTFCVHAGTYPVSEPAILKTGDKIEGELGTITEIDTATLETPATKPTPVAKLTGRGTDNLRNLLRASGDDISISWVDLSENPGTGLGSGAIGAGSATSDFLVKYVRIHNNRSLGISNFKGRVFHSEFFSNSEGGGSLGVNGSAIKGITEYEAGNLYVHDEQGNGLWCDSGCDEDTKRENGFWVHDSVVVESGRAGIRYENSPSQALFEHNEIHENGKQEWRGGIDIRDSQNARVLNNKFGPADITIGGDTVHYSANGNRIGVRATDSGRSDRVNLSNILVAENNLNGDRIVRCDPPVVECRDNTNVGGR